MVKIDLYSTRAVIRAQQVLTVGLVGVPVRFSFSEKWKCLSKVAVFRQGEVTVDVLLPGNLAVIPWQVLQEPGVPVQIGVYGMDADGKTVIPTVWAVTEPVRPSADPNGGENLEPASPLWQQVLSVIGSVDQLDTKEKQTLVQAINEANRAVHLVKVTGKGLENAGQGLPDALEAGKMALCYWEREDVYLPLINWVSDRDMTFSAVLRGVEYFVNIDPVGSRIYRCAKATFGGGGVYVGPEEPRDDGIILWVDPENDTPSDVARVLCVTVSEENGTLVADHYFEDIAQRLDQGYQVFCRYGNNDYRLLSRVSTRVIFGNLTGAVNAQIRIGKKNAVDPVAVVKTNLIPAPEQAKPGQVLGVKSVDSTGSLITWGPVDLPSGGGSGGGEKSWELYDSINFSEDVADFVIGSVSDNSNAFVQKNYTDLFIQASINGHAELTANAALQITVNTASGGYSETFQTFIPKKESTKYFLIRAKMYADGEVHIASGDAGPYATGEIGKWQKMSDDMRSMNRIQYFRMNSAKIGAGSTIKIWGR